MTNNQIQITQQVAPATYRTGLAKVNDTFMPMITAQLQGNNIQMSEYKKQCVLNSLTAINTVLDAKGISINDADFDRDNLTDILLKVASLELNPAATPREVYFQTRNVKKGAKGKEVWVKQVEMGIEGDGNDAIVAKFGRNVKTVHQFWEVREGDVFVYPRHRGIELTPPEWEPKGEGKVIRVVYPVSMTTGEVVYHIAERKDVIKNLIAHVKQNMMNETFGIAKSRFDASAKQKEEIDARKDTVIKEVEVLGLDAALEQLNDTYAKFISPAWKEPQSRESMIIRKMRNNITKKIPKDFGNAYVTTQYDEATDEDYARVRKDITEQANRIPLDFESTAAPVESIEHSVDMNTGEITHDSTTYTPHVEQPNFVDKQQDETLFVAPKSDDDEPF